MASAVENNTHHWQSVGSTLMNEYPMVTHLRPTSDQNVRAMQNVPHQPSSLPNLNRAGSLSRESSVRSAAAIALRRSMSAKLSPAAKLRRFFRRFQWNKRVKSYAFGKSFLQRQPSFVITPDMSSYSYSYKTKDLARRKPRPRAARTSQPIASWKNSKPMDVLMNNGQVDLSTFLKQNGEDASSNDNVLQSATKSKEGSAGAAEEEAAITPSTPVRGPGETEQFEQNYGKISLPIKHGRTSSGSQNEGQNSSSTNTPPTASTTRSRLSWLDTIPQTPISASRQRNSTYRGDDDSILLSDERGTRPLVADPRPSSSSHEPKATDTEEQSRDVTVTSDTPAARITPETTAVSSNALAQTTSTTPPHSPTSLPSSYRPESWRRSAIIARSSLDAMAAESGLAGFDAEADEGFVGAWSTYIKRAVAQRAVNEKKRMSREIKNEVRWSKNLEWDSDPELRGTESEESTSVNDYSSESYSVFSGSHTTSSSQFSFSSTSGSNGTNGGSSTSSDTGSNNNNNLPGSQDDQDAQSSTSSDWLSKESSIPSSGPPTDPSTSDDAVHVVEPDLPRAVTVDSTVSLTMQPSSPKRMSTSRLAPLNSPRAMASASALASSEALASPKAAQESPKSELQEYSFAVKNSRWQPEHSHLGSSSTLSCTETMSSMSHEEFASRKHAANAKSGAQRGDHGTSLSAASNETDFDFTEMSQPGSRKRPLPLSPLATPSLSPQRRSAVDLLSEGSSDSLKLLTPVLRPQQGSSASLTGTSGAIEPAPTIIRSQSLWIKKQHQPQAKRVRSSTSREALVHTRQKTMESLWGEEDESDDVSN